MSEILFFLEGGKNLRFRFHLLLNLSRPIERFFFIDLLEGVLHLSDFLLLEYTGYSV